MEGINVYGKGVGNVYNKGAMDGCYEEMNNDNVYVKGRVNGYQIVPIDGYDRLRTNAARQTAPYFD